MRMQMYCRLFAYRIFETDFYLYDNTMLKAFFQDTLIEAGCDEAGRGCLAGPVFAAAVILPKKFRNRTLNDSKQLTEKDRYELRDIILEKAIAWAVGQVDHEEIDRINIFQASYKAMHLALDQLMLRPELLLIDGKHFIRYQHLPHKTIIKGDGIYASIAAASILAKTFRDDFMNDKHHLYPHYRWNENKGYATAAHRSAIAENGLSPLHRKTFRSCVDLPELEF
ncbi:ribonuclease HII [Pollutibacter soli]|uniref:ribonuclease HII n=1 Tax=Pollutibacter soli TaxID=3034157 RepID=UPI003013E058